MSHLMGHTKRVGIRIHNSRVHVKSVGVHIPNLMGHTKSVGVRIPNSRAMPKALESLQPCVANAFGNRHVSLFNVRSQFQWMWRMDMKYICLKKFNEMLMVLIARKKLPMQYRGL